MLLPLVTGCGGAHRYDERLVQADSLMWTDADSALLLVNSVGDSSLRSERDRAYRDLLMTQARYKCYQEITAHDDSAITRAMDYFSAHSGEREKLVSNITGSVNVDVALDKGKDVNVNGWYGYTDLDEEVVAKCAKRCKVSVSE